MPVVEEREVTAYAHCLNPVCDGYFQQAVKAVRVETGYEFRDNGGDIPGVERSMVAYRFALDAEGSCAHCHGPRELSDTPRPSYQPLSGHDPMGLLNLPKFDPAVTNTLDDQTRAEMDALKAQIAELTRLVQDGAD